MAARVLHTSIFQMFVFHYQNENMPFNTLKWKEKVLKKICMPLKWQFESESIHISQSDKSQNLKCLPNF